MALSILEKWLADLPMGIVWEDATHAIAKVYQHSHATHAAYAVVMEGKPPIIEYALFTKHVDEFGQPYRCRAQSLPSSGPLAEILFGRIKADAEASGTTAPRSFRARTGGLTSWFAVEDNGDAAGHGFPEKTLGTLTFLPDAEQPNVSLPLRVGDRVFIPRGLVAVLVKVPELPSCKPQARVKYVFRGSDLFEDIPFDELRRPTSEEDFMVADRVIVGGRVGKIAVVGRQLGRTAVQACVAFDQDGELSSEWFDFAVLARVNAEDQQGDPF